MSKSSKMPAMPKRPSKAGGRTKKTPSDFSGRSTGKTGKG
jgi:hypothetical protein